MEAKQARTWDAGGWPALGLLEWARALLSSLSARFDSWRSEGDEDDLTGTADPELVEALRFIASLFPQEPDPPFPR